MLPLLLADLLLSLQHLVQMPPPTPSQEIFPDSLDWIMGILYLSVPALTSLLSSVCKPGSWEPIWGRARTGSPGAPESTQAQGEGVGKGVLNEGTITHLQRAHTQAIKVQLEHSFPELLTSSSHLPSVPILLTPKHPAHSSITVHAMPYFCKQLLAASLTPRGADWHLLEGQVQACLSVPTGPEHGLKE